MKEVPASTALTGPVAWPRMTPSGRRRGVSALLAVQLLFGLFPLFGKYAYEGFSPFALGAWRMSVGGLVLGLAAALVHGRKAMIRRADLPRLVLCSLLGVVINILLFLKGLQLTSSLYAGLTLPLIPVYTIVLASLLGHERLDWVRVLGVALAALGAAVLAFMRVEGAGEAVASLGGSERLGLSLFFLNTLFYALYLVLVRPLFARYPPLVVAAWVFVLSIPCVPFFAWGENLWPASASPRAVGGLVYAVVGATILSYLLNAYALSKVSASTTASFIFLQPAIVVLAGVVLLKEQLAGHAVLSGLLTCAGVWLVAVRPARAGRNARPSG